MADLKISALTDGAPAQGTDIIPVARGAGNRRLTLSNVKNYTAAPIPIAFADVASETTAGNLIDGQLYSVTGYPAFSSGIQLVDLEFRAMYNTLAGVSALSMEGVATDQTNQLQVGLTVDWYTSGSPAIGVVVPYLWNELRHTDNVTFGNEIDILKWNDPKKVYRSTIHDFKIANFHAVNDSIVITNCFIQSGSSLDMDGFTGFVMDHVNLGYACNLIVTADSLTIQDIRTGSNNTIYLPANGITGGIWGSSNMIGDVNLGFAKLDNITMGNGNTIKPDVDGIRSLENCEWGDGKTHIIKASHQDKSWISGLSTFDLSVDMSNDVDISGTWDMTNYEGYGVIYMSNTAPATIANITHIPHNIHCKNFGTSYVFDNSGNITFETVAVNTGGALAAGSAVTSLTTGTNSKDCFDLTLDALLTDPIIKNITLT